MFFSHLLAFLFNSSSPPSLPVIPWHEASIFQIPTDRDPQVQVIVDQYLQTLSRQGLATNRQGIWIQSNWAILADNQGKIPAPAASLTKIATTIASLNTWDLNHRFLTKIYTTGNINNGILQGDLIVEYGGDPLFVWEEAIVLGHKLQQLGINQVQGDLIIVGNWQMNYEENPIKSGELLKQGLNSKNWSQIIEKQYKEMKNSPSRPNISIKGSVKKMDIVADNSRLLLTHESLTLREILRLMNVYSNNKIAESLAQQIGGGAKVADITAKLTNIPREEILLQNGSGLGVDNRISPRAACRMLMILESQLEGSDINMGDLFPVAGVDKKGTVEHRNIPYGIPMKTGTLSVVSALAGVIPTAERNHVYFAIINYGSDIEDLRHKQDILLRNLEQHWTFKPLLPQKSIDISFGD
ncbi:D-alanyl-D-alanine carboxypeptidase [Geminocystis sp. NIES-3709]|uniref:D-alanyl-D-alanine carboxypeptidase n=1 Tax=Geminocystis sp. NIES-3709 TaxID=1617448 RepID=UPI0005FCC5F1|nr:D-alanyl-D-alanine carboxypeptidase [Geminocystis sp. NIES-3709]BAQ64955.1 D-alanyl-D-alanine carboxypeptidase [Geminocystis sp. NIES-3709]